MPSSSPDHYDSPDPGQGPRPADGEESREGGSLLGGSPNGGSPNDGSPNGKGDSTRDLVAAVQGGDEASWGDVDARYRKRLAFLVRGRIPKALRRRFDTEDVVQSTILAAYSELSSFQDNGAGSFQNWISAILRNRLASRIRFHRSRLRDPAEEVEHSSAAERLGELTGLWSTDSDVELADSIARVLDTLGGLPAATNDLIQRRFFDGQTFDQMATGLGVSECAARRRVSAALIELRRRL